MKPYSSQGREPTVTAIFVLQYKRHKMAEGQKDFYEFGYPDERFETVLSDNLHCAICSCVLKDPAMCKNEHCFCRGCITKHLENSHTCPCCNQDLTVESLADAPRIVRNLLSEQRIRCDHHERGCQEIVQLGNLASHVAVCGKAPVVCANEECSSEINREDQLRHESEECRSREVKCRNCKEMASMVQEIGTSIGGLCEHVEKLNTSVNEMKTGLTTVKGKLGEMEIRYEKVENQLLKMKEPRFGDDNVESAQSDQATPADLTNDMKYANNPNEYAYVVAGGDSRSCRCEIFDKTTNSWIQLQPMTTGRAKASSVVYNGQVLVTGGTSNDNNVVSSIEQYSRNANPLVPPCWSNFPVNLPRALKGHCTVVYNDRMFVIGGYDEEKKDYSDIIYEIQLRLPFTTKVVAKLPSPRPMGGCGVVLVNDKILIFGGHAKEETNRATAKVTMYDITKNEFQDLAPLPYEVCNMATAKYEENVFLAGGLDSPSKGHEKDTVVSYNVETQKGAMLPPMTEARSKCCAVVDGNSLVVMGGEQKKVRRKGIDIYPLSSVEAFDFKTSNWRNLPPMTEARKEFIAEVV